MAMPSLETTRERNADIFALRVLPEVLTHNIGRFDDKPALTQWFAAEKQWKTLTYKELHEYVIRWQRAFMKMELERGSRVAMLLTNSIDAVAFDLAALSCALVPVPLHAIDTPGSSAFILNDSEARVLVTAKSLKWKGIREADNLPHLKTVIITDDELPEGEVTQNAGIEVKKLGDWLSDAEGFDFVAPELDEEDLAALVYTSGTTGRPKGVMLTHKNIMSNLKGILSNIQPTRDERWFSFLPLSHTFERTATMYLSLAMSNRVYFNRNILQIVEDLKIAKPTVMMSVPRIYERIYARVQETLAKKPAIARYVFNWAVESGWRQFCKANNLPVEHTWREFLDPLMAGFFDKKVRSVIRDIFGGAQPHAYISGGAALNQTVARFFIGLGLPLYQGYGMTETSPVMTVNSEFGENNPATVGTKLPNVELRLGEFDELQAKGPTIMKGYWKREADTAAMFTEDGWLKTGDQATQLPSGHFKITGRIKEIIVTSTGEKIPPADLEMAIEVDPLFSQTMAIGEDLPYISALLVLEDKEWKKVAAELKLDPNDPASLKSKVATTSVLRKVKKLTRGFPQYGVPRAVALTLEPWTIENGMLTPTLKLKRRVIRARYQDDINALYDDQRA